MHESTKGTPETEIDREVAPVYDRSAFWTRYRKSIIPKAITTVKPVPGSTDNTQRTWENPDTGQNELITTGKLYELLNKESQAMQKYFDLLTKSDSELKQKIEIFLMFGSDFLDTIKALGLPTDTSPTQVQAFRKRIADDYRLLSGSFQQLKALAGETVAKSATIPPAHHGDRHDEGGLPATSGTNPAENRRPELGFLTLPQEVVVALTEVGLAWGAIDFGGASGDVMHFDCRFGAC